MANFQTIQHPVISRGMDTRSALRNIQAGFAADIRNMNTNSAGFVTKRKGFQGAAGNIPLRVTDVLADAISGYELGFDGSVLLKNVVSSPIIAAGKFWTTTTTIGSLTRTADMSAGGSLSNITDAEVGETFGKGDKLKIQDGASAWHEFTILSGSGPYVTDYSGGAITGGKLAVKQDTCFYQEFFINNSYKSVVSGTPVEFQNKTGTYDQVIGVGLKVSDTTYELIETDTTEITATRFKHTMQFAGSGVLAANYLKAPTAVSDSYSASIAFGAGSFTITQATHQLPNKNLIAQFWLKDHTIDSDGNVTAEAGTNVLIEPDSLIIKPSGDVEVSFIELTGAIDPADEILVVFEDVPVANTAITGLSGTNEAYVFTMPIEAEFAFVNVYLLTGAGQEQVKVESLVVDGDEVTMTVDLPAGAGSEDLKIVTLEGETGNSTITIPGDGVPDDTPEICVYGIQPDDISFRNNAGVINTLEEYSSIGSNAIVAGMGGNLFVEDTICFMPSKPTRIRGTSDIDFEDLSAIPPRSTLIQYIEPLFENEAITQIVNNFDGTVTVTFANPAIDLSDAEITSQYLKVSGAGNTGYNGVFQIVSVDDVAKTAVLSNSIVNSTDKTETDTAAIASIDTCWLELETGHNFLVGDVITSNQFPEYDPIIRVVEASRVLLGGISGIRQVYPGVIISGKRTTDTVQVELASATFVKGDMCTLTGYNRQFRVLDVVIGASLVDVKLDETIEVEDNVSFPNYLSVPTRWKCIELPNLNVPTVKHFAADYDLQERLQTARINDSIFYTDYTGSVMKYDGFSLYRAGLPNFKPQTHSFADYSDEKIVVDAYSFSAGSAHADGHVHLQFTFETMPPLPANGEIYITGAAQVYTEKAIKVLDYDASAFTITVSGDDINASQAGEAHIPLYANYYFKLQAYDRNNNIIASATSDDRNTTIKLLKSGKAIHQFTNFPKFDSYDYERIDVEIYRTLWAENPIPEFYRISTIPLEFSEAATPKVFSYVDLQGNSTLSTPNDVVSNAISVTERPINYAQPQKCKYLTSVSNRLVQGNIQGYEKTELRFDTDSTDLSGITVDVAGTVFNFETTKSTEVIDQRTYDATNNELSLRFAGAGHGGLVADQWIHLISEKATTDVDSKDLTKIVGWWKIKSITDANNIVLDAPELGLVAGATAITENLYAYSAGATEVPVALLRNQLDYPYNNSKRELVGADNLTAAYDGAIELAKAINRVQMDEAAPKLYAEANSPLPARVIKLTAATPDYSFNTTVSVNTGTFTDSIRLFANNLLVQAGTAIPSTGFVFPSRILISPVNFPETFDNPLASSAIYSSSIVDVNADDGQEITGFSSFFADSNSSDSQLQSTLIVFKSSSVYALDVNTRILSKLESHGQGCTIPSSIAPTTDGIMFANDSGIYAVTKSLDVVYVGKPMEGYWSDVNVGEGIVGFTDSFDRTYRLAVPKGSSSRNSEIVNYDYITEQGDFGAWSLWDGISPAEWIQTEIDTYYGNYSCRVFKQRTAGEDSDYRDDSSAITASFTYSPRSFGDGASEVLLKGVVSHIEEGSNISVYDSTEFSPTFNQLDTINTDGTRGSYAIESSPSAHSVLFYQVKYEHSTKDEGFKLTGIDFKVDQTNGRKITQAGES